MLPLKAWSLLNILVASYKQVMKMIPAEKCLALEGLKLALSLAEAT